jgi:hypothetical protein
MKKSIMLFSVLASLSFPAMAEDASWPREPVPGADNNGGVSATTKAATPVASSYEGWRALFPVGADAGGQHPSTPEELANWAKVNKAHREALVARLHAEGRCNAEFLPTEFAAFCWSNAKTGGDPNPLGGGVGSSVGGGESASSGSDAK